MSLNGKKVGEFALKAYKNGEFIDVTDKDLRTSDPYIEEVAQRLVGLFDARDIFIDIGE